MDLDDPAYKGQSDYTRFLLRRQEPAPGLNEAATRVEPHAAPNWARA
jgi:hypothetical protein